MKISLLFPPTWHPSQPYLSLPSLTGFLRQGGISDVSQRDLGIELLDTVLTKDYAAEVYQHLIAKQHELERTQTGETGPGSREHYVKVIDSLEEGIDHVNRYGTGHSEAIVTGSTESAQAFTSGVDAAAVYVNASTRFTDGAVFGMGAEIGNSTQKLHARGPIGLRELTTYKFVVEGSGQVRE